ncbi:RNA-guided endonuclease IscB [Nitrosococcus halophilus]|uniref:RNA-guided endonuclease IscB n=1 Tax=Nitrosococcus halophilus TaxID=133539 RepID=UPI001EEFFA18|nr:RNA-guided endonuclease IscB [Nitrosococcus halophilus]
MKIGINRTRPKGWLPPPLRSRVENVSTWFSCLLDRAPITECHIETVRFDLQKIQNPEISGVEYQQGELQGYEVREYLLEKWGRKCAYCGKKDIPLEVEHSVPRFSGGSDRVSNLTLACTPCNQKKNNKTAAEFGYPQIQSKANQPLKDAAAVNATRYAIGHAIQSVGLPTSFWSGGRTKRNRLSQGYSKDYWIDASCVGIKLTRSATNCSGCHSA